MKLIKKIKTNKGVSLVDVGIAIILITMFAAIIGNMFYIIYLNVAKIRLDAITINYAVKILEDTDKFSYEEVDNEFITKNGYDLPKNIKAIINVEKYSDKNPDKEDIIKIITLTINYTLENDTQEFTFKKLKIKEI